MRTAPGQLVSRITMALMFVSTLSLGLISNAFAAEQIAMRLNFTPWAMHSPYFAAQKQGFYAEEGLDVDIRPAAAGQQSEVFVGTGREQFGVANSDSFIKARASGLPLVAIMADQPSTPFAVIALKSSGIAKPADLKGKKLGWLPTNMKGLIVPLLESGGLKQDDVEFVNISRASQLQFLVAGKVDAFFGYFYGQPPILAYRGYPTNVMRVSDYGTIFQGDVIYTNEDIIKHQPELVKKFLRATLKGMMWTQNHMDTAIRYITAVAPERIYDVELGKLKTIYELYNTTEYKDYFGAMNENKWNASIATLASGGSLKSVPAARSLYTNDFIKNLPEAKEFAQQIRAGAAKQ